MNTPQSMLIGWGSLIAAAGISYHFAKKEINARRKSQREAGVRPNDKREWYERLEPVPAKPTTSLPKPPPEKS